MTSKKCCVSCQSCLVKLQQCRCSEEAFDAVENFSGITSGGKFQQGFCKCSQCCHLVKWICPCCCQNKIPLHCRIHWRALRGEVFGEMFIPEEARFSTDSNERYMAQSGFDW